MKLAALILAFLAGMAAMLGLSLYVALHRPDSRLTPEHRQLLDHDGGLS